MPEPLYASGGFCVPIHVAYAFEDDYDGMVPAFKPHDEWTRWGRIRNWFHWDSNWGFPLYSWSRWYNSRKVTDMLPAFRAVRGGIGYLSIPTDLTPPR